MTEKSRPVSLTACLATAKSLVAFLAAMSVNRTLSVPCDLREAQPGRERTAIINGLSSRAALAFGDEAADARRLPVDVGTCT